MPNISNNDPMTATAAYFLPRGKAGKSVVFEIKGTFGSGSAQPGYDDGAGNFVALKDANGSTISVTTATAWRVFLPASGILAVNVTASGTTLTAAITNTEN